MLQNVGFIVTLLILVSTTRVWFSTEAMISPVAKAGCESICGSVTIQYPFGIGSPDCFYNEWFEIICQNDQPYLRKYYGPDHVGAEVLQTNTTDIYGSETTGILIRNNTSIMYVCEDTSEIVAGNLTGSPFYFGINKLMVLGCGNAMLFNEEDDHMGCTSVCDPRKTITAIDDCYGINCCQENIVIGYHTEYYLNFSNSLLGKNSCASVFMVEYMWFPKNVSVFLDPSADLARVSVPVRLGWDILTSMPGPGFGNNKNCKISGLFWMCSCPCGFYGNPYIPDGCQDRMENQPPYCSRSFLQKNLTSIVVGGTSLLISILVSTSYLVYKTIRKRIEKKATEKRFKRNGGLLLQKYLSSNENIVEKVRLFSGKDLNKATDDFNENRVLGRGGQGTVYKGMLDDGKIVAIKKSKLVDANQVEEFINEIIILSQIDHRNVVKLLGCCLEMDVPMLVYEFVQNGTLYNLIHNDNTDFPLSWEVRLRISLEVTEALAYLHSATSFPVYHRDIKSSNILLDEKYRAKVADFGTSKHIGIDQTHLTTLVKGTFGYLDPEYFRSSQFTEKSDVYSFGVVLVELLTGLKPICYSEEEETSLNLATRFLLAIEENCVDTLLDPQVRETSNEEELRVIIKLSQKCLNMNGKNRPTMKEIVMELGSIKKSRMPTTIVPENSYGKGNIKEKQVKFAGVSSIDLGTSSSDDSPLLSNSS